MDPIDALEKEILEKSKQLFELRKSTKPVEVKNYTFKTLEGDVTLSDLFGTRNTLFVVHNMGQGCRYCTTWADGFNGFVPHLESEFGFVLVSKDPPEIQRALAVQRGWKFRMASHGGGDYIREQSVHAGGTNEPGLVCYERKGEKIYRKNVAGFGFGDAFCALWSILSLAGVSEGQFIPQFNYWKRPEKMDDGGQGIRD